MNHAPKKYGALFFCLVAITSLAQSYQPSRVNPRAMTVYNRAMVLLGDDKIKESLPLLQKAIELDTNYVDAYLSLAGAYGELKQYQIAVDYYQNAQKKDSSYFIPYNLPYSINLAGLGKFEEALTAINRFLSINTLNQRSAKSGLYRKHCYEFAVNYQQTHPQHNYVFVPMNLGDSINSEKSEYYPSLTIDDSLLVFTRRGEGYREDFMESTFKKDHFTKAKKIEGDINIEPSKGAITVSADGEWLIFAGNFKQGLGDFDLYISYWTPQGWSEPENLGPNVNSEYWDSSPSLSPDNRTLYFSSNRPGGIGGKDLYSCSRTSNGKWSKATNMGPLINSLGDETAPYIHADNQTLYYTSDGLPGYGNTDLFVIRKNKNGEWSIPENLGYPINTIENEGSIAISSNGLTAYYASDRADTRGGLDLYQFQLRADIQPHKTLYVKGKVIDATTNKGLPCAVELIDNSNNTALMHIQTDELGKYFIPLPSGNDYTFTVNRKGYIPFSEEYLLSSKASDSTYQKDIALHPLEVNKSFIIKNIEFATNSFELLPIHLANLNLLLQLLIENPSLKVQINGYTDNMGNENDNLILSTQRAKAVAYYLASKKIDVSRLGYKGHGSANPIANNDTEEGRAKNRRTEFLITAL